MRTERLLLRPATPADSAPVWRYRQQEPVSRWLTRAPGTLADFRAHFESPEALAKAAHPQPQPVAASAVTRCSRPGWAGPVSGC